MTIVPPVKRSITARREPTQKRAKIKVELILDATKGLLISGGIDKLTTNHIAKAAGMSVGALYQYFPNKQAVIYELFSRWLTSDGELVEGMLNFDTTDVTPEEFVDALLDVIYGDLDEQTMKYEMELSKAMLLYPELAVVEHEHSEQMAELAVGLLMNGGVNAPRQTLLELGHYIYGLNDLSERLTLQSKCSRQQTLVWQRESILAIIRLYP